MNFNEQMNIENAAMQDVAEAVGTLSMQLRGEITRLQEENRELVRQYAKLNDEHNDLLDQRELLIQSACNEYHEMWPDFQELSTYNWPDLWHNITEPLELQVRAEMIRRGCVLELYDGKE